MIYTISILAVALIVLATVTYRLICRVQELDTRVRNGLDLQMDHLRSAVEQTKGKFDEVNGKLETIKEKHNKLVDFTSKELEAVDELKGAVKEEIHRLKAKQRTDENTERGGEGIQKNRAEEKGKEEKQGE